MLEFSHVSVSCGHTPILEDISVSFPAGQITTLIGPNGCGKTTLLQCLNGVSKVTAGHIRLNGNDYLKLPPKERARKLAFLPQVRTIIPVLPVRTLVEHGRFPHLGFSRKKSKRDVEMVSRAMDFTHVAEYADCCVDTLSGGIRQRVFFAMVLAQDCDYIVLDEPTTYLDISGQREFLKMVCTLREQGKTVILILHDLNQALRISDRLLVMNDRTITAAGTPESCLASGVIEDVFQTQIRTFTDGKEKFYFFL